MVGDILLKGAITGFQTAFNLIKSINQLGKSIEIGKITFELQEVILTLQNDMSLIIAEKFAMIEEIDSLKKEITAIKAWESEKHKYELKSIVTGIFAYVIKESMKGAEPIHQICAKCYENGHKSILQSENRNPGRCHVLICNQCNSELYIAGSWEPAHKK